MNKEANVGKMKTTRTIEKFELKISGIMNDITSLQKEIARGEGIQGFIRVQPQKHQECLTKLAEAHRALFDAIGLLVEAGNRAGAS